jgi:Cys-tRNA(Pro) deacylase
LTKFPITPAINFLDKAKVEYTPYLYEYREFGAIAAAKQLNVDVHLMIKTLVMETEAHDPFIVLMHGEKSVSAKKLARQLSVKTVSACSPKDAQRYTGYRVGGISPLGMKRKLPIYVEKTILNLPKLYINAGRRGFLIEMTPSELTRILNPKPVSVAR